MPLAFAEHGAGPPLIVLHGLFGSSRNWAGIARRLGERFRVHALDLRNHGGSFWDDSMTYAEMAGDVRDFMTRRGLSGAAVLGHSMGGKTAMVLALGYPGLVGRLIVVDIAPVAYGARHQDYVDAMRALPLEAMTRRSEAEAALAPHVADPTILAFLLHNITRDDGRMAWRINLPAIDAAMEGLTGFPDYPGTHEGPALFLSGGNSDFVHPDHHPAISAFFPRADFAVVPDAGHWVHAERPEDFSAAVLDFLGDP